MYPMSEYVTVGGLMSYGAELSEAFRRSGIYVARVLRGDKPADLPVQQATKIELTVNLKTTKALGLDMPLSVLMRINETIE